MIPKTIHYCWFGGAPLPESAQKCIRSWKKFFPDYEIMEWNESNFNVEEIPYTAQAYSVGKYAFVSDYARFKILHDYGGIYFDTDVEVIKSFDDILKNGPYMGMECKEPKILINPGLGFAAIPKMGLLEQILSFYRDLTFINEDGSYNTITIVKYTTEIFEKNGLINNISISSKIAGFILYSPEYFNPLDDLTGKLQIKENTHSIHWYSKSWINTSNFRISVSRFAHRIFGTTIISSIKLKIKDYLNRR